MSVTITIAGTDRTADIMFSDFSISKVLTSEQDSCTFVVKSGTTPTEGQEVIVTDSVILFAGIIDQVQRDFDQAPGVFRYTCNCRDYTYMVDQKLVVETYENQTADYIFNDIVTKYCTGFTTTNVQSGAPVIEYMVFNYKKPSDCFKELCAYVGWDWYVDNDKDLHFFTADNLCSPAPVVITSGVAFRNLKHDIDIAGLRNRIYVIGGTMLSDSQTIEWAADGVARQWVLPWGPHEISYDGESGKIGVGEVAKSIGIENVDDEAAKDYLLNYKEKYIRCSSGTTTPAAGTTISLTAKQDIDVITMVEDEASQTAVAAVQGGDGIYEYMVNDDSLVTLEAATAAGDAELRDQANPAIKGSFETEITGWEPGQLVEINLSTEGITNTFLIQKVTLKPVTATLWTYKVEYGGRLKGIADYLKSLISAQQNKKLNSTSILHKITQITESIEVSDQLTTTARTLPYYVEESQVVDIDLEDISYEETTQADFQDGTLSSVQATVTGNLELTSTTASNVCTGGTAFGSGGTTQPSWAFNGLLTGHGYGHGGNYSILTLGYIFAAAKTISKLRLYISQEELNGSFNAIGAFKFYGSNDTTNGSDGTWTQITTGTMNNTADTWQEYSFSAVSYSAVKVVGDSSVLYPMIVEMEVLNAGGYASSGYREKIISIAVSGKVAESTIEWTATTPTNTSVTVEAALSTDGGGSYGSYQTCTSGSAIPGITSSTDLSNAKLKIKESLATSDTSATPQLNSLDISITQMAEFETVGGTMTIIQPGTLAWANPRYQTSEDGSAWSDEESIAPDAGPIVVPYPGYVRTKADSKVKAYNFKAVDETDVICGFVEVA